MSDADEIAHLLNLSARLGRDPLLTQASSGNTSIKQNGTLWIKASGTWLASAVDADALVPVPLEHLRASLEHAERFSGAGAWVNGRYREASVETAMHAVLPHKVVVHVHSVNTIALAVRSDGADHLTERLAGMHWSWIPYVASGLPLAAAIERRIAIQPGTNVFVLENHGLVVCGDTCDETEEILREVERRVESPLRLVASRDWDLSLWGLVDSHWTLPRSTALHRLGTDPVNSRLVGGGILFPCQAIFLGTSAVRIVEGRGILVNRRLTKSQQCVLHGLAEIVNRIPADAPIRYLTNEEVADLLTEDAHNYHLSTENNAPPGADRIGDVGAPPEIAAL